MKAPVPDEVDWVMDYFPRRRQARLRRFLRRPALWFWIGAAFGAGLGSLGILLWVS